MSGKLRAIDLYSGVGGWSLGLRLAGIEVVASYERWGPANETNFKNNLHQAQTVDIRRLSFDDLPKNIDIVVGSPPCTQFSFSNRGGSGNLDDGLEDIIRFLSVVDHIRPKVWAMENVPRVASIIEKELKEGGRLHKFSHLGLQAHVVNMEDFGVPQRRRRCIAGNFDFGLLETYVEKATACTLGEVIKALSADPVIDPLYGLSKPRVEVSDNHQEDCLNEEEIRINRSAKLAHPIYNAMPFPDPMDRSVRTITATCTRVSRESVVVANPLNSSEVRRLTLRERACLQGFPITFQFYGASHAQKLRMIGNAIPPAFAFMMGQAFIGRNVSVLKSLKDVAANLNAPSPPPPITVTDSEGAKYPQNRKFRFSIASLRLKSGVRFELANVPSISPIAWQVVFWFGNSKSIQTLELDARQHSALMANLPSPMAEALALPIQRLSKFIGRADFENMQNIWSHRGPGATRPFMLLDELAEVGKIATAILETDREVSEQVVERALQREFQENLSDVPGVAKLIRNAPLILAGLILGSLANQEIAKRMQAVGSRNSKVSPV
ncbi:DNA (cytosine-5-)-methyltransferase [Mesorhizobium sp. B2-4-2]|uniref:DNA cytosine methyltransferase n=1 Tax=Mesorhizobium sp. B2-4-2 TaxID=2589947 RepID=UPI0015E48AD5|nr:DNA (cytosine-5-)-methyltransferase [Mesorhizobium sp. B2-4-2]